MHDVPAIAASRTGSAGHFCWIDLAATDAASAKAFYGALFGWTAQHQRVNGGSFTRLRLADRDVGSLYQLSSLHRDQGVPSHWTPYIQVDDMDDVLQRIQAIGGKVLVPPLIFPGIARIALILDAVGAQLGLWQPIDRGGSENDHG
ncbi:VOC family protein [Taklimakanibacter deserti]|uniref:VOC family protein n=1 Tax=Taklimakanibacter deserti TaxID=2267839 RepID=UPI000E64CE29